MQFSTTKANQLSRETYSRLHETHPVIPDITDAYRNGRVGRRDFLRTVTLLGLSASSAYALAGFIDGIPLVNRAYAQTAKSGGRLRVAMNVKEITHPGVFDWSEKGNLGRQVIEPLVKLGPDNIARPHLLESWTTSADLKQWTLKLRHGIQWSNGDSFNADDVVFNFQHWLDPATGSSNISRFSSMTETVEGQTKMIPGAVEKIDDMTVRLNLRIPDLAIPESLCDYPALIVHRRFLEEGGNFIKNPVGTGAFELVDFVIGERALFRRRPTPYWGGKVYLDEVLFVDLGDDQTSWLSALLSNQIDLLYRLDLDNYPALKDNPNIRIYQTKTGQTGVARMHINQPPFDNKLLRQAIQSCIDHEQLLNLGYQGLGIPGEDHHVSPAHPEYVALPKHRQDYSKARYLLGAAGYPEGLSLSLDCVTQPRWEANTSLLIAEQLKAAGINVKVNVLPGATYWDSWNVAPFGFTSWTHRALGVQVLNLAYRSNVPWNETGYANLAFDTLLDKAGGIVDVEERKKVMVHLERIMQEDAIIVQPYWRSVLTASNKKVNNFQIQPSEELDLKYVWLT